ncbi:hypothetical protein TNCV_388171 [Trichonephila clavipes]|nr:hypothetical protein TNCV_388171 [Trichonephila clavipes]
MLIREKKSATKTFQILTEAYGDETLSSAHVFEWHKRFSGGRVCVEDEHAGRSSVAPARISSQTSRHCWRSPLPHASELIQRYFGCVLGIQQTKQLPQFPKLIWCGRGGCNLGQSLSNHGPHVFYR